MCDRALEEHGRLDVFFANVSLRSHMKHSDSSAMYVYLLLGRRQSRGVQDALQGYVRGNLLGRTETECSLVCLFRWFNFITGVRVITRARCFLAAKHATRAMEKAHPESGKLASGGSIIFTASSMDIYSNHPFLSSDPRRHSLRL